MRRVGAGALAAPGHPGGKSLLERHVAVTLILSPLITCIGAPMGAEAAGSWGKLMERKPYTSLPTPLREMGEMLLENTRVGNNPEGIAGYWPKENCR